MLLLGMMAAQSAQATCDLISSRAFTPTMRMDATVPVGAIMYDETWTRAMQIRCPGGVNKMVSILFDQAHAGSLLDGGSPASHTFESSVSIADVEQSVVGTQVTHLLPPGTYDRNFIVTVNLRYRRGAGAVTARLAPPGSREGFNTFDGGNGSTGNPELSLSTHPLVSNATCAISSQTVPIPPAPLTSFTGIGSVPSTGRTDFDVSFLCTNVNAGVRVGLSFSTSDQHASQASGVIRTNQDANNAKDIALQLINRTSSLPIKFGQFEPGVAKTANGQYHNIYRVQYFQSGANPTAGAVTGQTTATVVYQ
jgi:type 1 fimbria pilin